MNPPRQVVHLTLIDRPDGAVDVYSNHMPRIGYPSSPAQSLSVDLCNHAKHAGHALAFPPHHPLAQLAHDLTDADGLGHAVPAEVRQRAAAALRWLDGRDHLVSPA